MPGVGEGSPVPEVEVKGIKLREVELEDCFPFSFNSSFKGASKTGGIPQGYTMVVDPAQKRGTKAPLSVTPRGDGHVALTGDGYVFYYKLAGFRRSVTLLERSKVIRFDGVAKTLIKTRKDNLMNYVNERIIKNKVGLLNLAEELGNISKACKIMGFSRETFYRYHRARDEGGIEALLDKNRRKPNLKNRVDESTEKAVKQLAFNFPAFGQVRASNELRKNGIFVSPSGVRSIWLRHNLSGFKQRLSLLEKKSAEEGILLTESQIAALEKKKDDDLADGEIETAHPGYLGSQDTFYVGCLKGVGRIYQQTFVDTYSKVAFTKLYFSQFYSSNLNFRDGRTFLHTRHNGRVA
jgi:hypothetical protein